MKKITFKSDVKNFDGCSYKYIVFYNLINGFLDGTIKSSLDIEKILYNHELIQFCIYEITEIIDKLRTIFEDELFTLLLNEINDYEFLKSNCKNTIKKKRIPIIRYGARGLTKTINTDNLPLINNLLSILYKIRN